jgi:hypothetical protein
MVRMRRGDGASERGAAKWTGHPPCFLEVRILKELDERLL